MDITVIQKYIDDGLISVQKHPTHDLYIYNYTPKVQYERLWDEVTLSCRGLILDGNGDIVSRPFKKFFNYDELLRYGLAFPNENFYIQDKMDGSLGITYFIECRPYIATRGSFISEQAEYANSLLRGVYKDQASRLDPSLTYLFEIIYPENKIVVDYKGVVSLTHISTIHTSSGKELFPESVGFPFVNTYGNESSPSEIHRVSTVQNTAPYDNREGVVITFEGGFKCKIKHPEYVRLHRIMTNTSVKSIWELLRDGYSLEHLLDNVPDEFYSFVTDTVEDLVYKFNDILDLCQKKFVSLPKENRKEFAMEALKFKYPSVLFAMLDEKQTDHIIWKIIKPI